MHVAIVVAAAENGVIGRDGGMPWRLSTDLKRFKALTTGHSVIMGRKTFDSIGKPLPNRVSIVVTRNRDWSAAGVSRASSLDEALAIAGGQMQPGGDETVFVLGGGEIYREALPRADRVHFTHVLAEIDGDTIFPQLDEAQWRLVAREDVPAGENDTFPTRYAVYERRNAAKGSTGNSP
ncbi:dihydrofolate reductase [Mesorhizobium xinjiangense]|uniref:dihydrofolate reductase n=1 Tax=Mesorhizobium xinjiangense TaxID=2678685 RepID=UPI0012EE85F0|nr:dihydrofolate reductase [Mesorhizobium xinjiangense]